MEDTEKVLSLLRKSLFSRPVIRSFSKIRDNTNGSNNSLNDKNENMLFPKPGNKSLKGAFVLSTEQCDECDPINREKEAIFVDLEEKREISFRINLAKDATLSARIVPRREMTLNIRFKADRESNFTTLKKEITKLQSNNVIKKEDIVLLKNPLKSRLKSSFSEIKSMENDIFETLNKEDSKYTSKEIKNISLLKMPFGSFEDNWEKINDYKIEENINIENQDKKVEKESVQKMDVYSVVKKVLENKELFLKSNQESISLINQDKELLKKNKEKRISVTLQDSELLTSINEEIISLTFENENFLQKSKENRISFTLPNIILSEKSVGERISLTTQDEKYSQNSREKRISVTIPNKELSKNSIKERISLILNSDDLLLKNEKRLSFTMHDRGLIKRKIEERISLLLQDEEPLQKNKEKRISFTMPNKVLGPNNNDERISLTMQDDELLQKNKEKVISFLAENEKSINFFKESSFNLENRSEKTLKDLQFRKLLSEEERLLHDSLLDSVLKYESKDIIPINKNKISEQPPMHIFGVVEKLMGKQYLPHKTKETADSNNQGVFTANESTEHHSRKSDIYSIVKAVMLNKYLIIESNNAEKKNNNHRNKKYETALQKKVIMKPYSNENNVKKPLKVGMFTVAQEILQKENEHNKNREILLKDDEEERYSVDTGYQPRHSQIPPLSQEDTKISNEDDLMKPKKSDSVSKIQKAVQKKNENGIDWKMLLANYDEHQVSLVKAKGISKDFDTTPIKNIEDTTINKKYIIKKEKSNMFTVTQNAIRKKNLIKEHEKNMMNENISKMFFSENKNVFSRSSKTSFEKQNEEKYFHNNKSHIKALDVNWHEMTEHVMPMNTKMNNRPLKNEENISMEKKPLISSKSDMFTTAQLVIHKSKYQNENENANVKNNYISLIFPKITESTSKRKKIPNSKYKSKINSLEL